MLAEVMIRGGCRWLDGAMAQSMPTQVSSRRATLSGWFDTGVMLKIASEKTQNCLRKDSKLPQKRLKIPGHVFENNTQYPKNSSKKDVQYLVDKET